MLNLDGGQEVGVQRFRAAAIQFSRDPAPPDGSFEEKRPIINEEEPPMDTKEHKFLLNYLTITQLRVGLILYPLYRYFSALPDLWRIPLEPPPTP